MENHVTMITCPLLTSKKGPNLGSFMKKTHLMLRSVREEKWKDEDSKSRKNLRVF